MNTFQKTFDTSQIKLDTHLDKLDAFEIKRSVFRIKMNLSGIKTETAEIVKRIFCFVLFLFFFKENAVHFLKILKLFVTESTLVAVLLLFEIYETFIFWKKYYNMICFKAQIAAIIHVLDWVVAVFTWLIASTSSNI